MATLETEAKVEDQTVHAEQVDGSWMMMVPQGIDWNLHALATQNVVLLQQFQMMMHKMQMQNEENEYLRSQISAMETTIQGMSMRSSKHQQVSKRDIELEKKIAELTSSLAASKEELEMFQSSNEMIKTSFVAQEEMKRKLETQVSTINGEFEKLREKATADELEISNLKKDLERKTENLRKSSDSQRQMSARIREMEGDERSLHQRIQQLQENLSEKNQQIEKMKSAPSGPSPDEKRLRDRLSGLEGELKKFREKAREYDRLLPIFNDMEMEFHILKSRENTYELSVNALRLEHDAEMEKMRLTLDSKNETIQQHEKRIHQMGLQNQRALRELGESEKHSILKVKELQQKLNVAMFDLESMREKQKFMRESTESVDACRAEVSSLRDRIALFERIGNDSVQRLKAVIRKRNELQTSLDGARAIIERYRAKVGDLDEDPSQTFLEDESSSDEEEVS
jgi:chromosome segregation ATPase